VDATVGRGRDTLFLARTVGPTGRVIGCDLQQGALEIAAARLRDGAPGARVDLIHCDHAQLAERLPPGAAGRIKALVMNLGFLPGGDRTLITRPGHTLAALDALLPLMPVGARVAVVAYTGHAGGREEARAVRGWMGSRPRRTCRVFLDAGLGEHRGVPELHWLQRTGGCDA
jgi:hypothetical protein